MGVADARDLFAQTLAPFILHWDKELGDKALGDKQLGGKELGV
jgi:hypothetical protein